METPNADETALIGQLIAGRYRIESLIDEGAMGRVFLAQHVLMQKRVALKVVRSELIRVPEIVARFEREVRAAANVNHPNVAAAMDIGHLPSGALFLVLEYVEGQTLRELLRSGPVPPQQALSIAFQVALALSAAHAVGIVHRDLKPENVMLVPRSDEGPLVKILDFGVAKVPLDLIASIDVPDSDELVTRAGVVFGTPDYMAPEQALGKALDGRADLYSLGILLYEMLAGVRPFRSNHDFGILGQQLAEGVPSIVTRAPKVHIAPAIEEFIHSLLAIEVEARIQSAEEAKLRIQLLIDSGIAKPAARTLVNPLPASAPFSGRAKGSVFTRTFTALPEPLSLIPIWSFFAVGVVLIAGVAGLIYASSRPEAVIAPSTLPAFASDNAPVSGGDKRSLAPAKPGSAASMPNPVVAVDAHPATSQQIETALAQGSTAIARLVEQHPNQAEVHIAHGRALLKDGKRNQAVDAVAKGISLSPALTRDKYVAGVLWDSAQHGESSQVAFTLLQGNMGEAGADILYDLAGTPAVPERYSSKARSWLGSGALNQAASPALKIAAELRLAATCQQRAALLARAAVEGDARSATQLETFLRGQGCNATEVASGAACNDCLRGSFAARAAISAIRARN